MRSTMHEYVKNPNRFDEFVECCCIEKWEKMSIPDGRSCENVHHSVVNHIWEYTSHDFNFMKWANSERCYRNNEFKFNFNAEFFTIFPVNFIKLSPRRLTEHVKDHTFCALNKKDWCLFWNGFCVFFIRFSFNLRIEIGIIENICVLWWVPECR